MHQEVDITQKLQEAPSEADEQKDLLITWLMVAEKKTQELQLHLQAAPTSVIKYFRESLSLQKLDDIPDWTKFLALIINDLKQQEKRQWLKCQKNLPIASYATTS